MENLAQTEKKIAPTSRLPSWLNGDWFWGLILVAAVILTYVPVWWAGFIWDDDYHLTHNPCIVGPLGWKDIWTTSPGQFFPLTFTFFWMEHALWGLAPLPYHLVNIAEQATCAVLLWQVLRSLQIPGAWLGAAIWALHPVQVESVAWISEMKNTQSGLFYLLTILFYAKTLRPGTTVGRTSVSWNYGLSLIFAALAMMSKPSTLVLPVVLGLCAWWVEGRWHWRHLTRLTPIFFMSLVATIITVLPRTSDVQTLADPQWARSWPQRVATSGDVVWFYLGKLVWPHPLIAIYPRWQIDAGRWNSYLPLLAVLLVLIVLWLNRKTWGRPWFFAFAYFLVALSPFLGLLDQSFWQYSFVEDHLQYLACMGPLALAGAGLSLGSQHILPGKFWRRWSLYGGVLLLLGILSWRQACLYQNEETLWSYTLARNPNCWLGYYNLGVALVPQGQLNEAMALFKKALEINPHYAQAHDNLGNALLQMGRPDEAMVQYQKALALDSNYAFAHNNLGETLLLKGQMAEAMVEFQKAVKINPNYAKAHDNLGHVLYQMGRQDEAIIQYQKALELNPNLEDANIGLGEAFLQKGQLDEAIAHFQRALEIDPNSVAIRNELDHALLQRAGQ